MIQKQGTNARGDQKCLHNDNPKKIKSWGSRGYPLTSPVKPNIYEKNISLYIWYELLKPQNYQTQLIRLRPVVKKKLARHYFRNN